MGMNIILEEACKALNLDEEYGEKFCKVGDDPAILFDRVMEVIKRRFGEDSKVIWLVTEGNTERYCGKEEEPVKYEIPDSFVVLSDLGPDGALILGRTFTTKSSWGQIISSGKGFPS